MSANTSMTSPSSEDSDDSVTHHRHADYMTEITDQGEDNSCYVVALLDLVHILRNKKHKRERKFSIKYLIDEFDPTSVNGSCVPIKDVLEYVRTGGLPLFHKYPDSCSSRPANLKLHRVIKSYTMLNPNNYEEIIEELRIVPLLVVFDIDDNFQKLEVHEVYIPERNKSGAHAMILVSSSTTEGGIKFWTVKSSYGEDWGNDGYGNILRCSIRNPIREVCRIDV